MVILKARSFGLIIFPIAAFIFIAVVILTKNPTINLPNSTTYEPLLEKPKKVIDMSTETKGWLLAVGAILSVRNEENFDQIKSDIEKEGAKMLLLNSWDVYDAQSAKGTIKWLKKGAHSKQFEKLRKYMTAATEGSEEKFRKIEQDIKNELIFDYPHGKNYISNFTWKHKDDLAEKNLIAWDMGRLVNVARLSYTSGFITEEEAWEAVGFAGKKIKEKFNSWEEFADNYLLGRSFWNYSDNHSDMEGAINWLENNPESPWKKFNWEQKLEI